MEVSEQIARIKEELKNRGWKYEDLSQQSKIPMSTILKVLSGHTANPRVDTMQAIENALEIKNPPTIKDEVELDDMYPIPLLGQVVAGVPIEAQENLEGYIYISFRPKEEYFAVRVHGDSMKNVGIVEGSILVVHKQETANNGDIVVAMLNKEQTVKRFKVYGENLFLMPENNDYEPIPVTEKDELIILGKVVEVRFQL